MSLGPTFNAFATLAADGSTASFASGDALINEVTVYLGAAGATFGSGTLKLQHSPDGGTTWLDVPSASWTTGTAAQKLDAFKAFGNLFRFNLAGSTSPTLKPVIRISPIKFANAFGVASLTADAAGTAFALGNMADETDMSLQAWGTFGSGTVALQESPDGGTTWYNVGAGLTANGDKDYVNMLPASANAQVRKVPGALYRINLTGSTSPALNVRVVA